MIVTELWGDHHVIPLSGKENMLVGAEDAAHLPEEPHTGY